MATMTESLSQHDSYKYQWARYVARRNLDHKINLLSGKLHQPSTSLAQLASDLPKITIGEAPRTPGAIKVGIVGAGCGGLFTGMILDFLTSRVDGLNISYDILEAAGPERLGGRLFTHYFSGGKHDYYDVGAMRFPKNDITRRTFQLFKLIGIEDKLIPYYLKDELNVCPSYYNDVRHVGAPPAGDAYNVNAGLPNHDKVREDLFSTPPGDIVARVIADFTREFKKVLDAKRDMDSTGDLASAESGWDLLMKADQLSTRQFFRRTDFPDLPDLPKHIQGPGFNFNTIEWLETFAYATGWYNQSLAETVLEELDFDDQGKGWLCIEGGSQQVATEMANKLATKPEFNRQVTAIKLNDNGKMTLDLKHNDASDKRTESRNYDAVFNSTTLAAMQRMDLTKAGLRYGTKQAIRSLAYGASCKVAIKFKTGWWMKPPHNITRGSLSKTDLPIRVCVYPSYNLPDADGECVLLCSYTWAQDAQRLASLILPDSPSKDPKDEVELKATLFHNLALLHARQDVPGDYEAMLKQIKDEYITHHSYDWYADQNMSGAFAYFGPGQFSCMWPEIVEPNGWLFLIGEAASAHHAWIVGALESAVRGVYQMLQMLRLQNPQYDAYEKAMKHLEEPEARDVELPFGPLPREMPQRQTGTKKSTPTVDLPRDATNDAADLTFTAAQVILSFLEWVADQAEQEERK